MSTNEQEKFNQWWDLKGTNSVILRAQAWSAWLARAEVEQQPHGTSFEFNDWDGDLTPIVEITEAEAMALLKKPEPQPQKTRVRLWARPDGGHIWFCPDKPANGSWQEIHHDSEGFYVEGGQS